MDELRGTSVVVMRGGTVAERARRTASQDKALANRENSFIYLTTCVLHEETTEERNRPQVARMTHAFLCHLKVIEVTHI